MLRPLVVLHLMFAILCSVAALSFVLVQCKKKTKHSVSQSNKSSVKRRKSWKDQPVLQSPTVTSSDTSHGTAPTGSCNGENGIIKENKINNKNEEKISGKEQQKAKTDGTQEVQSAVSIPASTCRGGSASLDNYLNNLVKTKTLHSMEKGPKTKKSEVSTTKIECKTQKSKKD